MEKKLNFTDQALNQIELITKGEKNKLSRDFMNFILSENFQSVIPTTNWMFPVTDIKVPETFENIPKPEKVLLMDSSIIEKNRKKWTVSYTHLRAHET